MNRRRFLSMLGLLPAALALPHAVGQPSKVVFSNPTRTSLAQDIKYGQILTGGIVPGPVSGPQLVKANGGEAIVPRARTREEETVDAIFRFHDAVKELTRVEERYGFKFSGWLPQ